VNMARRFFSFLTKRDKPHGVPLNDVLSIYSYEFLGDPEHRAFVERTYLEKGPEIEGTMRLILHKQCAHDPETVRRSVQLRYPVYYGRPEWLNFRKEVVSEVLGYDVAEAETVPHHIRYAIMGRAFTTDPSQTLYVIHLWGVNLETNITDDYKTFVKDGRLDVAAYRRTTGCMARMALEGAREAARQTKQGATLRVPAVGAGQFLNALTNPEDRQAARYALIEALADAATLFPEVNVDFVDYSSAFTQLVAQLPAAPFNFAHVPQGDLFAPRFPSGRTLVLVNPWDPKAFIGNGGSVDPTPDGFMVAATGPGRQLPNSSFLHNWFFVPKLLDEAQWIRFDME